MADGTDDLLGRSEFDYDAADRLVAEDHYRPDESSPWHEVDYTWDLVGNLIDKIVTAEGEETRTIFTHDERDQILTETLSVDGIEQLSSEYTYDLSGNLTGTTGGDVETLRGYDVRSRLVSFESTADGRTTEVGYVYDDAGLMVRRSVTVDGETQTQLHVRDGLGPYGYSRVLEERTESGVLIVSYVHGHSPHLKLDASGGEVLHLSDAHSGVRQVIEAPSGLLTELQYNGFGNVIVPVDVSSLPTLLLYRGERIDDVTEDIYLRARHYTPGLVGFSQVDPFAGLPGNVISLHRYQFGDRDPIQKEDPNGMWSISGALTTVSINAGIQIQQVKNGGKTLGAGAARLVQQNMHLNYYASLLEEPFIRVELVMAKHYHRNLISRVPVNLPRRTQKVKDLLRFSNA